MSGSESDPGQRRIENLRAVLAGARPAAPAPATAAPGEAPRTHRARNGTLGSTGAALLVLAGKLKFLGFLGAALKLKTLLTILLSISVYATQWGLPFATGFVLLILVHELGHAAVLHREGIPAGAPVFIPFFGAFIAMRGRPRDAYVEAKVALGGPVAGSLASWAVLAAGVATGRPMLVSLGHASALLNLFNLIPISPLDGGRAAGAFSRPFWIVGYVVGIAALVVTRSPLLLLVLLAGLWTLWRQWKHPVPGDHAISRGQRLAIGFVYGGLVLALTATLGFGGGAASLP